MSEVGHRAVNDNLEGCGTTSISEFNEGEVLATHSCGTGPAGDLNDMVDHLLILGCCESSDPDSVTEGKSGNGLLLNGYDPF